LFFFHDYHYYYYRIIFRDLKPENLAFDLRGDMRLFDFGLAKELKQKDRGEAPDGFNATGLTGSRRYMAPEVILCKNYGLSADVYSYAILVWEVFSDKIPFPHMCLDKHFEQVVLKRKRPKTIKSLPKEMHKLIDDAWSHDRSERPKFRSICEQLASQIVVLNCTSARSVSDRTAQLMDRSLRSRLESTDSLVN
jgi:serine/threonine protein kinase